jgi:hypothetical protein
MSAGASLLPPGINEHARQRCDSTALPIGLAQRTRPLRDCVRSARGTTPGCGSDDCPEDAAVDRWSHRPADGQSRRRRSVLRPRRGAFQSLLTRSVAPTAGALRRYDHVTRTDSSGCRGPQRNRLQVGVLPKRRLPLLKALLAGDVVNLIGYRIRPCELEPGATDRALEECKQILSDAFMRRRSCLPPCGGSRRVLAHVRVNRLQAKP